MEETNRGTELCSLLALSKGWIMILALTLLLGGEPAAQPPAEPPVEIAMMPGKWEYSEKRYGPLKSFAEPVLSYTAQAFPRLGIWLVHMECSFTGDQTIELSGLVPAQRFPQPAVSVAIGGERLSGIPNATYLPRVEPSAHKLAANARLGPNHDGKTPFRPGHPPYARLTFSTREKALLSALPSGKPITFTFQSQTRTFPPVPEELARKYVERCGTIKRPDPAADATAARAEATEAALLAALLKRRSEVSQSDIPAEDKQYALDFLDGHIREAEKPD